MDDFFIQQSFNELMKEKWLSKYDGVSRKKLKMELFSLELDNRVLRKKLTLLTEIKELKEKKNKKSFFKKCCFWL